MVCGNCTYINPKTNKQCKKPASCKIGCITRCSLHGIHSTGRCEDYETFQAVSVKIENEASHIQDISAILSELDELKTKLGQVKKEKTKEIEDFRRILQNFTKN